MGMSTIILGKSVSQESKQREEICMGQREDLVSHVFGWERGDNRKGCVGVGKTMVDDFRSILEM
jgi:hypothetical protein